MNSQQGRVSTNGYNRRRGDTVTGSRMENHTQSRKSASPNFGRIITPSRDRLIYVLSLLIGRHVEVHVKNGSIISGILHATNADRDFEIVLKMAQVVKDGSVREQKSFRDSITSSRLMIVPARELVQLLAKEVSLDEFTSGLSNEKGKDLLIDSVISHSHHLETERELTPWIPDGDDPECPELENIFDGTLDRKWDQFETNAALFGVKSTFNEELYTTKLEKGPQMKELEKVASRIAREIEGQEAHDFHQAEERGLNFHDNLGLDEESRYSAVRRENNNIRFRETDNTYNSEIFSGSAGVVTSRSSPEPSSTKVSNEVQTLQNETLASSKSSSLDEDKYLHADKDSGLYPISHDSHQASDCITQSSPPLDAESRFATQLKDQSGKTENTVQESRASEGELEGLSTNGTLCSPSASSQGDLITETSDSQVLVDVSTALKPVSYRTGQDSSPNNVSSETSDRPSLSPRSCGSLSSEKSSLNPNAKEFKFNPNAKSFSPSTSERPHAEVSDGPFYYPNNVASFQHMHGLPVGMGVAPFGHQPVFYNPHAPPMQSSQAYIHPNGSMYGQQMIVGQPPQFYYVQGYPPEMPHKGRKY
ncbi:polyadenylate-binding protein-interacting protein 4-like [Zingiber officinale]|uniref:LsmAD domain-containing protein n=1 Tax=Zingiber officinale TaxID=94328 RepID=A0A8J5F9S1_ZINOF|nr:polyadenylate-binding protein-interacting protein 4-like [Zingiber officinale]XP_042428088.1 polyadenylate-binding protein-interacting protein 4-like [Zingiber officinale]KAG6481868.1 hypothetical protein ZIOFF_058491 [Zingiber officinale]